ncbi:hypothetical protein VPH35_091360 [Triticum aestivum]|uniref:Alanyl-tRNA synthetase class IIc N-terminal domain-containing protein n=1 Tax=Triticum aestivum TaxID=4565 RepID=A0A3B6LQM7_WHEAT|nr:alanine--tRNA ligase-like [Triticum aestivum]
MEGPPDWTAARDREVFINYFESKSWPSSSSPLVPVDDPATLFANAGMNQFKPVFLGTAAPDSQLGSLRGACNSQKRIRAEAQRPRRRGEGGGHRVCVGAPVGFLPSLPLLMLVSTTLLYLCSRLWIGKV